ncbi:uncharacterized protein LOC111249609 isoform X2 [Varroa destructor]|uniref:Uncharacterized protein n=1 Tax=Varroa destructor TaxID=109461 RepID=A0A7M7K8J9_VARDE|nr:uncharacterized protein LOC111249609 isoform X2 [Varroa destructor]
MNFVQTIVFCIGPMTAFADHMECYECTWDAYHKVDSAARKQKQKELQDFGKMSYPLKWMLPNSTFFGNEAISTYPEKADLERLCSKCSLGPSTVCVKWKFFTSVKNNPLNVTWGCVSSVERGCFEEKAAKDLYKEAIRTHEMSPIVVGIVKCTYRKGTRPSLSDSREIQGISVVLVGVCSSVHWITHGTATLCAATG